MSAEVHKMAHGISLETRCGKPYFVSAKIAHNTFGQFRVFGGYFVFVKIDIISLAFNGNCFIDRLRVGSFVVNTLKSLQNGTIQCFGKVTNI